MVRPEGSNLTGGEWGGGWGGGGLFFDVFTSGLHVILTTGSTQHFYGVRIEHDYTCRSEMFHHWRKNPSIISSMIDFGSSTSPRPIRFFQRIIFATLYHLIAKSTFPRFFRKEPWCGKKRSNQGGLA